MTDWGELGQQASAAADRMMTRTLLAIDPGETTGWSLWALEPDAPLMRLEYGAVLRGVDGFLDWAERQLIALSPSTIIFELFNPHLGYGDAKNYEALEIQGCMRAVARALALQVAWHTTAMKALCRDDVLKRAGLYIEPAQAKVDEAILWKDARDVNDSQRHALAWAKAHDHQPSIRLYWPNDENVPGAEV